VQWTHQPESRCPKRWKQSGERRDVGKKKPRKQMKLPLKKKGSGGGKRVENRGGEKRRMFSATVKFVPHIHKVKRGVGSKKRNKKENDGIANQ